MARHNTVLVLAAIGLFVVATAQPVPSPGAVSDPTARCIIYFDDDTTVQDNSTKSCLKCQEQCVGLNDGQCGSFSWNGTLLQNPEEAPIFQCSSTPVANDPAIGTCAFFAIGQLYPTSFSLKYCDDCRDMCVGDSSCEKIAWGGNVLVNGPQLLAFSCPPKPSPRPSSPAIIPSPTPSSPALPCTNPYAYISTNPQLSTLKAAVDAAGLQSALDTSTLVATLFAPTNAAFTAAFTALGITAEQALADTTTLTSILSFHLVPGVAATASQLNNGQTLTTALGDADKITVSILPPSGPTFSPTATGIPAGVVTADVRACASVIHVINQVLVPPAA